MIKDSIVLYLAGIFFILCSILNWEFFFKLRFARRFDKILKRKWNRIVCVIIGIIFCIRATMILLGIAD